MTASAVAPPGADATPGAGARRDVPWACDSAAVLVAHAVTADTGLSPYEVARRLATHGPNRLAAPTTTPAIELLRRQFGSVIVWLLLAAAALSLALADVVEALAIAAAVALTVALGFVTELRAVRSMESLRQLGVARARVRREGREQLVDAAALVPGDLVVCEGGDRVPADLRLIEASKLQADESSLTGESVPVSKRLAPVPAATALPERSNMLFRGTVLTRGSALGVVVATGPRTELGRIASLLADAKDEATPLEARLAALGRRMLWLCLAVAALITGVGVASGRDAFVMLETGIALAVAAIPEGLPVVATIALARGMKRLAEQRALVKRLAAVETLGATSVIVADKTGTLTQNRMSVTALSRGGDADERVAPAAVTQAPLRRALEIGALCNNATLTGEVGTGDPLEVALLAAADAAGLQRKPLRARWPELREEAFDAEVKMMATVHSDERGVRVAVKGAPEAVLAACTARRGAHDDMVPLEVDARRAILDHSERLAADGLRVLALADRSAERDPGEGVYAGLVFAGLVALADPPRLDVADALAACRRAGIRVIMATGDGPTTAASIARAVGLGGDGAVVHGATLAPPEQLGDAARAAMLAADVFARVTPEQKLDIIELHQQAGAVVAMTGDGVNDAPALRKADIGIAMGHRGTDVARDAAAMVLEDDAFGTIVAAVAQGRAIFENVRRFVVYLLSCNIAEVLIVAGGVLFASTLPLLPLQILFLNLVTDVLPALALGFGRGDPRAMEHPPRDPGEPLIAARHWRWIASYAGAMTAAVLGAMALAEGAGASAAEASSVAFVTLGFAQLWHVFNLRGSGASPWRNDVVGNPWIWLALLVCGVCLLAAALVPPLMRVLAVAPLGGLWLTVLPMSLLPLTGGQLARIAVDAWSRRGRRTTT